MQPRYYCVDSVIMDICNNSYYNSESVYQSQVQLNITACNSDTIIATVDGYCLFGAWAELDGIDVRRIRSACDWAKIIEVMAGESNEAGEDIFCITNIDVQDSQAFKTILPTLISALRTACFSKVHNYPDSIVIHGDLSRYEGIESYGRSMSDDIFLLY